MLPVFTDLEITSAIIRAVNATTGTTKTITRTAVFIELGIKPNSRYWDSRDQIITRTRMSKILLKNGFIRVNPSANGGKKARYVFDPVVHALLSDAGIDEIRKIVSQPDEVSGEQSTEAPA